MVKQLIKKIANSLCCAIVRFFYPLKFLGTVSYFISRTFYSQYKRLYLKKSHLNTTISYPINLRGGKYITTGKDLFLGPNGILSAWSTFQGDKFMPQIIIGDNVTIGNGFHISAINKIEIGDGVLMGKYITIVDNSHGTFIYKDLLIPPIKRRLDNLGSVIIGKNVWIGDKVTIAKGVKIGDSSVIGSNSVVINDVLPFSVVAGSPAKLIKEIKKNNGES